jgi:hypothetical protein
MALMSDTTALPPLDDAASLAGGGAAVAMSEVARARYSDAAMADLQETDRRLGTDDFPDPAKSAHQAACQYLICAGDFVKGMQYVTHPSANLSFSSSALARSACEFANRASWLADPNITEEQRIARGVALLRKATKEETSFLELALLAALRKREEELDRWRKASGFTEKVRRVPDATRLFQLVNPGAGDADYRRLSHATHGSFLTVVAGHHAALAGTTEGKLGAWWRVLIACQYGLEAAIRITNLQQNEPPESFQYACVLGQHYWDMCLQWEDAHRT